jgi:hypothetical protein
MKLLRPARMACPLLLAVALVAPAVSAQSPARSPGSPGHVVTKTRLVALFSELEEELSSAAERKDSPAAARRLAEDFELRSAAAPGEPVSREDWLAGFAADASRHVLRPRQMAVHAYGDAAVVSFAARHEGAGGGAEAFVVDVWVKQGRDWQLGVRYLGSASEMR